jgi:hypothetical protein
MTSVEELAASRYALFPPDEARMRATIAMHITRLIFPILLLAVLYFRIFTGQY